MTYKGIIRIKCVDLANWAAREGVFQGATTDDPVRFGTEGRDTVIVYVEKTDALSTLMAEFQVAIDTSIEKFAVMSSDLSQLMNGVKAVLAGGENTISKSFKMQLNDPGVPPYIEVVIKAVE